MNWLTKTLATAGHRQAEPPWDRTIADVNSRSGFVRERAVLAIARSGNGAGLPHLLVRANDWVAQVRQAAVVGIGLFLTAEHLPSWAKALPEVEALGRCGRVDHGPLLTRIHGYLATERNLAQLLKVNPFPSRAVSRLLFTLGLRVHASGEPRVALLSSALAGHDIVQATMAAHAAYSQDPAAQARLGVIACRASAAAVRAHGMRILETAHVPLTQDLVLALAMDTSPLVRAMAISRAGEERATLAATARSCFAGNGGASRRAIALDVLCSLPVPDVEALVRMGRDDAMAAVRSTAFARLFAGASGPARDQLVIVALGDASARVRRQAVEWVRRGAQSPALPILLELSLRNPTAFPAMASVAARQSPWSRLQFLLSMHQSDNLDGVLRQQVEGALRRWADDVRSCFVSPSQTEISDLSRSWAATRDGFPMHLQQALAEQLRAHLVIG